MKPARCSESNSSPLRAGVFVALFLLGWLWVGCTRQGPADAAADPHLATNGTVQITARLLEIPQGAIFQRDLYDYATVLKYQVLKVERGKVDSPTIYVAHYNPWKPRQDAADKRAPGIGGNVRQFQAGQVQHLALEVPVEDFFMGGIVDKYFGQKTNTIFWAVWTDLE